MTVEQNWDSEFCDQDKLFFQIKFVLMSVPAIFNDAQRHAITKAGKLAGFSVLSLTNDLSSIAVAYGIGKSLKEKNIIVFYFERGLFEAAIFTLDDDVYEAIAIVGDMGLCAKGLLHPDP